MEHPKEWIIIRGAGDLATGVIQKLHRSGLSVIALEVENPTAIRRTVALSEAIYNGEYQVEDVRSRRIASVEDVDACLNDGIVPIMVDPQMHILEQIKAHTVIDATLAKRNWGMHRDLAPITIGLGPGFTAGQDVDAVIETMRGHDLARLILDGKALANTGIPGEIGGKSSQRVIHAPVAGLLRACKQIGDVVEEQEIIAYVDNVAIYAPFKGILRGLIRENIALHQGMKIADIDPRLDVDCLTISDKARALGGAVLEAYFYVSNQKKKEVQR